MLEPTIFTLTAAIEKAHDDHYFARFIDNFQRMEFEQHKAKVRIDGLTERIRAADLLALPPKEPK